jgi:Tfp pilus assembly protein PilF/TolB-like protein
MKKRRPSPCKRNFLSLAGLFLFCAGTSFGQATAPVPARHLTAPAQGGVYLVFPFENAGASPRLDWIGEGIEELAIQEFSTAGQQVYSHEGRLDEMDRDGLPSNAKLSRATMLHIAEEMDADYVVFGNFTSDGTSLKVNARVLRVNPAALLPVVGENAPLTSLMDLQHRLDWRLLTATDRAYPLTLAEFSKLQRPLQLGAFEQYIRGLLATEDEARIRDLKEAARLEPEWPSPAFALGSLYFARNECGQALTWFARVPPTHERSAEANFYAGVCYLRINQAEKAEKTFNSLQEDLKRNMISGAELPEVLNNLALARARQGNLPSAFTSLGRARDLDPDQDDYPFNLGLLCLQGNDFAAAATHFRDAIEREPDNPEDWAFLIYVLEKGGKKSEADQERGLAQESLGPNGIPALKLDAKTDVLTKYQRLSRELDTTTLRLELAAPQVQNASTAAPVSAADAAIAHIRRGRQELAAGRLDSAETEFHAALAADSRNAFAHRELADIYRRRGKLDAAVQELQVSLASRDSAAARVTLARIYLEQKKPALARAEVEKAVKLAPNYAEARELLDHLQKSKPTGGAQ